MTRATIKCPTARVAIGLLVLGICWRAPAVRADVGEDSLRATVHRLWVLASDGAVRHRDMVKPSMDSLVAMGMTAVPSLVAYLATEDARERHAITDIFQGIGSPAVPSLVALLGSGGRYHTLNTLDALGKIGDSSATAAALPFLHDTAYVVRAQSAEMIGKTGGAAALTALFPGLRDSIEIVRKSAVVALGRLGDRRAYDSLLAALDDGWFGVRYAAAAAMAALDSSALLRGRLPRAEGRQLALVLHAAADRKLHVPARALLPLLADRSLDVARAAARFLGVTAKDPRARSRIETARALSSDPLVRYHLGVALASMPS
jgi:HEAT repeat protein